MVFVIIILEGFVLYFLAVICILIAVLSQSYKKARPVYARVISCEQKIIKHSTDTIYEVTADFYDSNGETIVKAFQSKKEYIPDDVIRCRYLEKKGVLMEEVSPEAQNKNKKFFFLFFAVLIIFIGTIAVEICIYNTGRAETGIDSPYILGYILSIAFIAVGVFGIFKKHKMEQNLHNMISLTGIQVDYKISKSTHNHRSQSIYTPIYEYDWGGEKKRFCGPLGSSGKKYSTIGRMVHILVNPQTGDAVCQEDEKSSFLFSLFFGIIGIACLALMIALSFG
ncbi:MAG: hypothetical protein K2M73_10865 [Lachnospiraceae bacterium]|nr:hypothetical protein [Lachnospiraceae bacterium]